MLQTITTTELRTKSKDLIETLLAGEDVDLIHRSKIVGTIKPKEDLKVFDTKSFLKKAEKLNLPKLSDEEIEKRYRAAMMKKHGKYISRRE